MKYYCNPLNIEYKYQFIKPQRPDAVDKKIKVYREAADPSLALFKGLYYMFPSMTAGFLTSDNLAEWRLHEFLNDMPVYDYAPDVCVIGDYLYFSASKAGENCSFFRTEDPLTKTFEEIKGGFPFWDPALFRNEDGRLYFYWGCSNMTPIYGVELEPGTMTPLGKEIPLIYGDKTKRGYERRGDDHIAVKTQKETEVEIEEMVKQLMSAPEAQRSLYGIASEQDARHLAVSVLGNDPFVEGAWMTKHNGKYYLQYAVPGTEHNIYADGVFVSDSPLGPFALAKNNPYSYKPGGFVNGAGHGSTLRDKAGNYWHAATMRISVNQNFERRLGLWKAGFDDDGELYCDQRYGDWPLNIEAPAFTKPDWMLLSYGKPVKTSSGSGAEHITDENIRTWWKADSPGPGEWAEVDLGKVFDVRAVQISFADDGMEVEPPEDSVFVGYRFIDGVRQYTRWLLEGSGDGKNYFVISDKRAAQTDLSHDLIVQEDGFEARFIRLTVKDLPYNQAPRVSGIRVFGQGSGEAPQKAPKLTLHRSGDLDMEVFWEKADDALGYNILWGCAPEKLYHSYLVFGKCSQHIGALIKGEPVFVRIDAFNESGITEGCVQLL
jgi:hypothetical protein